MHLSDFVLDCLCLFVGHDYHSGICERSMQAMDMLTDNINRYRSKVGEHAGEQLVVFLTLGVFTPSSSAPRCETLMTATAISRGNSFNSKT